jgi:hypothetical protein
LLTRGRETSYDRVITPGSPTDVLKIITAQAPLYSCKAVALCSAALWNAYVAGGHDIVVTVCTFDGI